jgi:hypothetical protein
LRVARPTVTSLENALAVLDNTDDAKAFNVIWVDPPPHFIVPAPNGG